MSWRDAPIVDPRQAAQPLSRFDRFRMGMGDPLMGAEQFIYNLLPEGGQRLADRADEALRASPLGQFGLGRGSDPNTAIQQREAEYQARRGDGGFDGMRLAGNIASPLNLAAIRAPLAATALGRTAQAGGLGAAFGVTQPALGDPEDYTRETLTQAGLGAATGVGMSALASPLARGAQRAQGPDVQTLAQAGVRPTAAQIMGGGARATEETLRSVPMLGGAITSAQRQGLEDFNRAAINRAVQPIGGRVESIGLEGATQAARELDRAYDAARGMVREGIPVTPGFENQIAAARQAGEALTQEMQTKLAAVLNRSLTRRVRNGFISSKDYKSIDSDLSKEVVRFRKSPDPTHQEYAEVLMDVQYALRDQLQRTNPTAADAFRAADDGYRHLVILERAADRAAANDGVFTPNQLLMMARQADDRVRNRGIIEGTATYADLALAGQRVMGSRVPDSGTAGRGMMALMGAGLGYGAATNPSAALMALGGLGATTGAYAGMNPALRSMMMSPGGAQVLQSLPTAGATGGGVLGGGAMSRGLLD